MSNILSLIGREKELFKEDIDINEKELRSIVSKSSFLVLGGAGSIGQAVIKEIFKRNPKKLHVVDISENNMVELVRDIRSSFGYIDGEFATFALDIGSLEYDAFIKADGNYDYVLNLSALKHVRSEKDLFTLMRMIETNIFNTDKTLQQSIENGTKKYFCVSTDKAANPVNMMGASKRIMEMFVMRKSKQIDVSMARFANVAFSDGSLLHGFNQRIQKNQPIVAPNDIKRYFVTPQESGELCLMSCIFGENRDIFFPKLSENLHLITFADIAVKYLKNLGYEPYLCKDEDEARELAKTLPSQGKWPCLFTSSDTTGEKDFEEFFTDAETLDMNRFENLGVVKNEAIFDEEKLNNFETTIKTLKQNLSWTKEDIVKEFFTMIPDFGHKETGKYLDGKNVMQKVVDFIKQTFNSNEFIPLHEPRFIGNEKKYLNDCIDSTFVSSVGKYVDTFEKEFAKTVGSKYAIATVNGTAALHTSLILADVKRDDEVITQPLTFIATCNAISYIGAKPIFVDVDSDTMGLSPKSLKNFLEENCELIENKCINKTSGKTIKACVPMHTFGHPCKIDEIKEICDKWNIILVEDAAESLGSYYKKKHTGTFGKLGAFSFNGNKVITSGGGGVVVTDDEALAKRAKHITTTAKVLHPYEYVHDEIGYNYRLPNINAALLVAQLEQLDKFLESKRGLAIKYKEFFATNNINFIEEPKDSKSNYWLQAVLLDDKIKRDEFLEFTNKNGVMTRPIWKLMNELEMFKDCQKTDLQNATYLEQRVANIPSSVIVK